MEIIIRTGNRPPLTNDRKLGQLPTPDDCMHKIARLPTRSAPAQMATPSSSEVKSTVWAWLWELASSISLALPESGTWVNRVTPPLIRSSKSRAGQSFLSGLLMPGV